MYNPSSVKSLLFGVAVGDALGVPVEFNSRQSLKINPVTDMRAYGTYLQPSGTWSDDSSLTFCLAEALSVDFDINILGRNFIKWYFENFWTPFGEVFDIGIATRIAINRLVDAENPDMAGGKELTSNGNGSLMRISPLVFYLKNKPIEERFEITRKVSSITHAHIRSVIACFYYLEFALQLLEGKDKFDIYMKFQTIIPDFLRKLSIEKEEIMIFDRLFSGKIQDLAENEIRSGGYVLDTLEASIWCLLTTSNYKESVLKAVNLGNDTDTTAAVTGGLSALSYGYDDIPENWINLIARKEDIADLADRMSEKIL